MVHPGRTASGSTASNLNAGLGLVYVGGVAVAPSGRSNAYSMVLTAARPAPGLRAIADLAQSSGVPLAVQIMHAGRQANPDETGAELVGPSPIASPAVNVVPRELTARELGAIVRQFADSAGAAADHGAALIEIHAAHGYLVSSFMSPSSNRRTEQVRRHTREPFPLSR